MVSGSYPLHNRSRDLLESEFMSFRGEFKRRNVLRVATAYIVSSWLIIQVVETIFPAFGFGAGAVRISIILLAVIFIPVLVVS